MAAHGTETASDLFYRQLIDGAEVAIIGVDPSLEITVWNAAAARLLDQPSKHMLGRRSHSRAYG